MRTPAVVLCGHGSRDAAALGEFTAIAATVRSRLAALDFRDVALAYLEFARPTIPEGLAALAARGARHVVAIPAMLSAGKHVRKDLPREMARFIAGNPGIELRLARHLAVDTKMTAAAAERLGAALPGHRGDTLLIVVGRGSSDPAANAEIAKLAGALRQELGFADAAAAFAGIAEPGVDAAFERGARRGAGRIVVFPYFLCTGALVNRIHGETDAAATRFPKIEFVKAGYLGDHPQVIDALVDRATGAGAA